MVDWKHIEGVGIARVALGAVRAGSWACRLASQRLESSGGAVAKQDDSPVTVADYACQAVVSAILEADTPTLPLVAEEGADELRERAARGGGDDRLLRVVVETVRAALAGLAQRPDGIARWDPQAIDAQRVLDWIDRGAGEPPAVGQFWTLDPIDGTKGFLRGGQYAVALALIERQAAPALSAPLVGVLGCPRLNRVRFTEAADAEGCLFWAVRNQGAWCGPLAPWDPARSFDDLDGFEAIQVSQRATPSQWVVCESFETGHTNQTHTQRWRTARGIATAALRLDSQAKYGLVARGEADVYLRIPSRADYRETIWDHAAGAILVQEAGGVVHDLDHQPLDFGQGRVLSRNRGVVARSAVSDLKGMPDARDPANPAEATEAATP